MVLPLTADASLLDLYVQSLSADPISPGQKDTAGALKKTARFCRVKRYQERFSSSRVESSAELFRNL